MVLSVQNTPSTHLSFLTKEPNPSFTTPFEKSLGSATGMGKTLFLAHPRFQTTVSRGGLEKGGVQNTLGQPISQSQQRDPNPSFTTPFEKSPGSAMGMGKTLFLAHLRFQTSITWWPRKEGKKQGESRKQ
ncbi:hypothetical protein CDAR_530351 [Caerostris darwini]|uniref:Uncharacterized protein n=1 Tax=Caerostris darwini TaxID=1538125 RepID=A0AAV4NKA1_9ARAC|nr:hypothetical protein CDAR_530351 [Caerostris darwini]